MGDNKYQPNQSNKGQTPGKDQKQDVRGNVAPGAGINRNPNAADTGTGTHQKGGFQGGQQGANTGGKGGYSGAGK